MAFWWQHERPLAGCSKAGMGVSQTLGRVLALPYYTAATTNPLPLFYLSYLPTYPHYYLPPTPTTTTSTIPGFCLVIACIAATTTMQPATHHHYPSPLCCPLAFYLLPHYLLYLLYSTLTLHSPPSLPSHPSVLQDRGVRPGILFL